MLCNKNISDISTTAKSSKAISKCFCTVKRLNLKGTFDIYTFKNFFQRNLDFDMQKFKTGSSYIRFYNQTKKVNSFNQGGHSITHSPLEKTLVIIFNDLFLFQHLVLLSPLIIPIWKLIRKNQSFISFHSDFSF